MSNINNTTAADSVCHVTPDPYFFDMTKLEAFVFNGSFGYIFWGLMFLAAVFTFLMFSLVSSKSKNPFPMMFVPLIFILSSIAILSVQEKMLNKSNVVANKAIKELSETGVLTLSNNTLKDIVSEVDRHVVTEERCTKLGICKGEPNSLWLDGKNAYEALAITALRQGSCEERAESMNIALPKLKSVLEKILNHYQKIKGAK